MKEMSYARQPLDEILSSVGKVRVLRALLAHGSYLPAPRVAADAKMAANSVRDVLANLELMGVVESIGSVRATLYRATPEHPMVTALDALFEAERRRFEEILAAFRAAVVDDRISAAWLFGSVARHEDRVTSDWDVAIVIDAGGITEIAAAVRDLIEAAERRLGFTASIVPVALADIPRLAAERGQLWSGMLEDARVLKGAEPREMAERARREA